MSLCIKSIPLCTVQTQRKVIFFDLQRGRKQSVRGAVLGSAENLTSCRDKKQRGGGGGGGGE